MNVNCKNCGVEFNKAPSQAKRFKNHYCSRSCSGKANNKLHPKRYRTKTCAKCPTLISSQYKYCKNCSPINLDKTLAECGYSTLAKNSTYALIRTRARAIAKKLGWKSCIQCGYDKHVEIAHIKPITAFDDSALISEVNHISNLKPLCPNCHWEHDHPNSTG